ncbi:MAG: class I SAM-dependent methyltransferase [Ruminococcaceae bacterium]|nr:class I SAM-dependent methyltransferase [Oscillospiraceae bacterium]
MAHETQFNGKAQFYNSRPTYPQECIDYLIKQFNLSSDSVIADIGAGTGILTKPFLEFGCSAYAVEPNEDMFLECNKQLSRFSKVTFFKTSAEKTGIPSCSCDAVVVGTAFHWFEKENFRAECKRILKHKKNVALLRIANNTEADKQIEKINHCLEQDLNDAKAFFGEGFMEHVCFEYTQSFDEERYIRHLLSSATAPLPKDANFDEFVLHRKTVFKRHFAKGPAELPFVVNCYIGRFDT